MAVDASAVVPAGSVPSDFVGRNSHFVAERAAYMHAKAHESNKQHRDKLHQAGQGSK